MEGAPLEPEPTWADSGDDLVDMWQGYLEDDVSLYTQNCSRYECASRELDSAMDEEMALDEATATLADVGRVERNVALKKEEQVWARKSMISGFFKVQETLGKTREELKKFFNERSTVSDA